MKVIKVICPHCGIVIHDIPSVYKKDPRVVVEVVYNFCSAVPDEEKKELLRRLRKKAAGKNNPKGGPHDNGH